MRLLPIAAVVMLLASGCARSQLRRTAIGIAAEIPDVQQQQVLDNLARLSANPDNLPYFAIAGSGTAQVGTTGNGAVNLLWSPTTILTESLNLSASRTVFQQYSVALVTEPDKLDLMRRTYQWTLGIQTDENRQRLTDFFGPNFQQLIPGEAWLGMGPCSDLPKSACYVGKYYHTAVWVLPEEVKSLTQLTLAILDIATAAPPFPPLPPPTREVRRTYRGAELPANLESTEIISRERIPEAERIRSVEPPIPPGETAPITPRMRRDFYDPNRGLQFIPQS